MNVKWARSDEIALAAAALPAGSSILILGAADTGKSFFARQIARHLGIQCGLSIALVDADTDQQEVGSPGTIGMLLSAAGSWPDSLKDSHPTDSSFVGALSPAAASLAWMAGIARMTHEASRLGAGRIVVDTPPAGPDGLNRPLTLALLDTIRPAMVVAISRSTDLDPILTLFDHLGAPPLLVRMATETDVSRKSPAIRSSRRTARFAAHFREPLNHTLALEDAALIGTHLRTGEPQPPHVRKFIGDTLGAECVHAEALPEGGVHVVLNGTMTREGGAAVIEEYFRTRAVITTSTAAYDGLLCGLVDPHRRFLDVALIDYIEFAAGRITLTTPLRHPGGIAQIVFGTLRLRADGKVSGESATGTI